ncbi:DUF3383 family protein [Novacetimonas pomaceti]|uniref:DUF3383 family protein n=1 Tax=Novacetimonas pomaceti TaxID=2021998 RepID=UPI001C2D5E52|nr:DUF3383 family protein [Novacetimonas pomaceti]MBV1833077.1 DUF3383 domain-containing protein [Novacetimonas pomaceti]
MSIPLSYLAKVQPGTLAAGTGSNVLYSLMLSENALIPAGTVRAFTSASAIGALLGQDSTEYQLAQVYFGGFTNSPLTPATLYVGRFVTAATAAYLEGAQLGITLSELQALSGSLTVSIDGEEKTAATLSFATVTSFSDAATAIQTALAAGTVTYSSGTGGFTIASTTTGATSAVSFASGTLAAELGLTEEAGAFQSPVVTATDVASQMNILRNASSLWASFFCAFDPQAQFLDFAAWAGGQTDNVCAILHDTAVTTAQITAGTSLAQQVTAKAYEGVACVYQDPMTCALIAAVPGSVDFTATNGRYNVAFRQSSLMSPVVTDEATAIALEGAGYNFYGQVAGDGVSYNGIYPGCVSGQYLWLDSYFNQMWMRRRFQIYLVNLLFNTPQIPYNTSGDALIESALQIPIAAALNFGAIRAGVILSTDQVQAITTALGNTAARTIQTSGYYLYVNASGASAAVRTARATPTITFYYTDGQSVQRLTMSSIEVE